MVRCAVQSEPSVPADAAACWSLLEPSAKNNLHRQTGLAQKIVAQQRPAQTDPQSRVQVPGSDRIGQKADFIKGNGRGGSSRCELDHHLRQRLVKPVRQRPAKGNHPAQQRSASGAGQGVQKG